MTARLEPLDEAHDLGALQPAALDQLGDALMAMRHGAEEAPVGGALGVCRQLGPGDESVLFHGTGEQGRFGRYRQSAAREEERIPSGGAPGRAGKVGFVTFPTREGREMARARSIWLLGISITMGSVILLSEPI